MQSATISSVEAVHLEAHSPILAEHGSASAETNSLRADNTSGTTNVQHSSIIERIIPRIFSSSGPTTQQRHTNELRVRSNLCSYHFLLIKRSWKVALCARELELELLFTFIPSRSPILYVYICYGEEFIALGLGEVIRKMRTFWCDFCILGLNKLWASVHLMQYFFRRFRLFIAKLPVSISSICACEILSKYVTLQIYTSSFGGYRAFLYLAVLFRDFLVDGW